MKGLAIPLSEELMDALADKVADRLQARSAPAVYTIKELAGLAKCCPETIRRNIKAGVLHKVSGAGPVRITGESAREWLNGKGGSQ